MTVTVPTKAIAAARSMVERGVSIPVPFVGLLEFAEQFERQPLPGLHMSAGPVVAGTSAEIILVDSTLDADRYDLIRLNGRVYAPEVVTIVEEELEPMTIADGVIPGASGGVA